MTYELPPPDPGPVDAARLQRVSWPLILGLGSLALLWPLAELSGATEVFGRAVTGLLTTGVVLTVWVGSAGLGRAPRPVLTLSLAGGVHGAVLAGTTLAIGLRPDGPSVTMLGLATEVGGSIALGALAGLLALTVQRARGAR